MIREDIENAIDMCIPRQGMPFIVSGKDRPEQRDAGASIFLFRSDADNRLERAELLEVRLVRRGQ